MPEVTKNNLIVYEDEDIIAVNKPAGLLVHPDFKNTTGTLIDLLFEHFPQLRGVGEEPQRPGIVHRLDRDTAGIMVVAKNNTSFAHLKNQFRERKVHKKYLALVHGKVKNEEGEIDLPVGRSPKNTAVRSTAPYAKDRKPAQSHYRAKERFENYTLCEVSPRTGRTHQIRVHMKAIGYPVVGDKVYKFKRQAVPMGFERMFLFARELEFTDRSGRERIFKLDLDPELEAVLAQLRKQLPEEVKNN